MTPQQGGRSSASTGVGRVAGAGGRHLWGWMPVYVFRWHQIWGRSPDGAAGALWMLFSALAFSLMTVCVKQVGGRLPIAEVVLVRALISGSLTWVMLRRAGIAPWGRQRRLLLLRGLIGSTGLLCVFAAVTLLPLASATVLQYLYPTFTALLAWLLLGERPRGSPVLATGLGWLGVVLVARPDAIGIPGLGGTDSADLSGPGGALPPAGVAIAIAGALCTALAYVTVRRLAASEHPLVIILYFPLVAVAFSLPLTLLQPVWPTPTEWLWLLGVGVFTQVGQIGVTRGLAALPAARATALSYSQVAFAGLWGWWLFGEGMDGFTVAGALVILIATLITLIGGSPGGGDRQGPGPHGGS